MRRIAAVDFGLKRIGLAVSDFSGTIALPLKRVDAGKTIEASAQNVMNALKTYQGDLKVILVGLPLMMDGTKGEMALLAEQFAAALEKASNLRVECVDERLTSAQADRALREMEMNRKERSLAVDSVSAMLLLQAYLERKP